MTVSSLRSVKSTCPYCGVGCGVIAEQSATGQVSIKGDPDHPANRGRLCSKGAALAETLGDEGRLLRPSIAGRDVSWDEALGVVADGISKAVAEYGAESVAFYVSGQLLTEDYYVANKLMKGFVGAANIDTNSRLCMSSAVAGHERAFGEDLVPVDYADLDEAELIVLVGSNAAWCHPVLMQQIIANKQRRPALKLVVIDPRRTPTAEQADLHLALRVGSDVALFNGLLVWLAATGQMDRDYVAQHVSGADQALELARAGCSDIAGTAQACGLDVLQVEQFFQWFAAHRRVVTMFSQGVNQSSVGTDKVNSIINCHLLTGRIGTPGMGPFSVTGQPNAMGGREVGGLATQLAAHLKLDNADHRKVVQAFWQSPSIASQPGLKAVDLFQAVDEGRIKVLWIMATNPVVSLPDADRVQRALKKCPLVIVSDCVSRTDTLDLAHVKLPVAAWGEKDGSVTNSDRHISRQRAFQKAPGEAQADWWIMAEVARRMGHSAQFAYQHPREIFQEHALLIAKAAALGRRLNLGHLAQLSSAQYEALSPMQWPINSGAESTASVRLFADGIFPTSDGRARMVPTAVRAPRHATTDEYPLVLNTGRLRDQWHTMTRTGRTAKLMAHEPEPFADFSVPDFQALALKAGDWVKVISRWGRIVVRARCSGESPEGTVFVPIHWSGPFAAQARVGAVVNPVVDPISGEPEFKHTPVRIERWHPKWQGFMLTRNLPPKINSLWWEAARVQDGWRVECAGDEQLAPDRSWFAEAVATTSGQLQTIEWLEYEDAAVGSYRAAAVCGSRLEALIFIEHALPLPNRGWLIETLKQSELSAGERRALLSGRSPAGTVDAGRTICACFGVGETAIAAAIQQGCLDLKSVGQQCSAGTNCGACQPEISRLLASAKALEAATATGRSSSSRAGSLSPSA